MFHPGLLARGAGAGSALPPGSHDLGPHPLKAAILRPRLCFLRPMELLLGMTLYLYVRNYMFEVFPPEWDCSEPPVSRGPKETPGVRRMRE